MFTNYYLFIFLLKCLPIELIALKVHPNNSKSYKARQKINNYFNLA